MRPVIHGINNEFLHTMLDINYMYPAIRKHSVILRQDYRCINFTFVDTSKHTNSHIVRAQCLLKNRIHRKNVRESCARTPWTYSSGILHTCWLVWFRRTAHSRQRGRLCTAAVTWRCSIWAKKITAFTSVWLRASCRVSSPARCSSSNVRRNTPHACRALRPSPVKFRVPIRNIVKAGER